MSVSMLSTFVKPMHPEGRKFVAIAAAITVMLFLLWEPLGWIGTGLTIWVYYFFRDPPRVTPAREGLMISPAVSRPTSPAWRSPSTRSCRASSSRPFRSR